MHDDVRQALGTALNAALQALQSLSLPVDTYLIWRKNEAGGWAGTYELRPNFSPIYAALDWEALGRDLGEAIRRHHPAYLGTVGSSVFGTLRLTPSWVLQQSVVHLGKLHRSLSVPQAAIDAVVQEFAAFVDGPTIPMSLAAPLVNFRTDESVDKIDLPKGLAIRRLSEDEVSDIHGGNVGLLPWLPRPTIIQMCEFALAGDFSEIKLVGEGLLPQVSQAFQEVQDSLSRAVLALRTFKTGQIGFYGFRLRPKGFCPVPGTTSYGVEQIPIGSYQLAGAEIQAFVDHARAIFSPLHASLEMACSRLADAETRRQQRDRLLDAVIGLEAVFLANVGKEEYRGEMRYRFSLNYSTLYDAPADRLEAFRVARSLYDLRSRLAHGGAVSAMSEKLGSEKLPLAEAALRGMRNPPNDDSKIPHKRGSASLPRP
jgi:hypothetical protein